MALPPASGEERRSIVSDVVLCGLPGLVYGDSYEIEARRRRRIKECIESPSNFQILMKIAGISRQFPNNYGYLQTFSPTVVDIF